MQFVADLSNRVRLVFGPVLGIGLILYVTYHAVQGDHGLIAYWQLSKQVAQAKIAQSEIDARRQTLETRVRLLSPQSLDPDMLDERVRYMLGYARPDEIIILR